MTKRYGYTVWFTKDSSWVGNIEQELTYFLFGINYVDRDEENRKSLGFLEPDESVSERYENYIINTCDDGEHTTYSEIIFLDSRKHDGIYGLRFWFDLSLSEEDYSFFRNQCNEFCDKFANTYNTRAMYHIDHFSREIETLIIKSIAE